jgi:hypothetical protein
MRNGRMVYKPMLGEQHEITKSEELVNGVLTPVGEGGICFLLLDLDFIDLVESRRGIVMQNLGHP